MRFHFIRLTLLTEPQPSAEARNEILARHSCIAINLYPTLPLLNCDHPGWAPTNYLYLNSLTRLS